MMKTVLCYGDSNTWGYEPKTDGRIPWKQRWPGILQDKLGADFQVVENGLCGRTTRHESATEAFVNGYLEARVCAEVNAPLSVAAVMLGTNDCKDEYTSEPADIAENVKAVAKVFQEKGVKILILSPAPIRELEKSPFRDEFGRYAEEKSRRLPGYLRKMADEMGWTFLETGKFVKAGDYDGIHLPAEEHAKLAEAVAKKIEELSRDIEQK